MSKTHEMLLSFEPGAKRGQQCAVFQRPLLATAPPEWYCASKASYDVAPRDTARFPAYEEAIDKNVAAYAAARERQHDYGMLNYGDWYGERGANWGNIEYDTQHAFFHVLPDGAARPGRPGRRRVDPGKAAEAMIGYGSIVWASRSVTMGGRSDGEP